MDMKLHTLFLSLASFDAWGDSDAFYRRLLACLHEFGADPQWFDGVDPPRRGFINSDENRLTWLEKEPASIGKWLFLNRNSAEPTYSITVHWVDQAHEMVRRRGDYNLLYGSIQTTDIKSVEKIWRRLCVDMNVFHGLLDTQDNYNRRAHTVLGDGRVRKTIGSYLNFIPGFFAHNYFGEAYLRKWEPAALSVLAEKADRDLGSGMFIDSPTESACRNPSDPYSFEEMDLIRLIGTKWFHLPEDLTERKAAPSRDDFFLAIETGRAAIGRELGE